jgi:hypothetical protein
MERQMGTVQTRTSSRFETIYLALFILGTVLPLTRFLPWLSDHGLDVRRFVDDLFANRISSFFALDVLIAVPILWLVAATDRDLTRNQRWIAIVGAALGASAGLPLYCYLRERNRSWGRAR